MTHGAPTKWPDLLQAVTQRLDRGGSPDSHFPDREGEYWALCPFHADKHPENFSVSEAGYHCGFCGCEERSKAISRIPGRRLLRWCLLVGPRCGPTRSQ